MEIWHRVSFNGDTKPNFKISVDQFAIKYKISPLPGHEVGLIYFDITETDPNWLQVESLIREIGASDVYDTIFTHEEILSAEWSRLVSVFERSYPQPQSSWSVEPIAYEGHCPECGIFQRQKESFRIKKEPRLGKNHFMSLYWTYALFTVPSVFSEFSKRNFSGYEIWDVIIHKTNQPSEMISQIYISNVGDKSLLPEDELKPSICSQCKTEKYLPHMRGYMKFNFNLQEIKSDFILTHE